MGGGWIKLLTSLAAAALITSTGAGLMVWRTQAVVITAIDENDADIEGVDSRAQELENAVFELAAINERLATKSEEHSRVLTDVATELRLLRTQLHELERTLWSHQRRSPTEESAP